METLARQALGDMRAAVANYRDVSLAGELATGWQLLRAAGSPRTYGQASRTCSTPGPTAGASDRATCEVDLVLRRP